MTRFLVATLLATATLQAQDAPTRLSTSPDPWFGTFSIIAFDPATNELGVGVQSRAFGAGAAVPYAKPGVGAVATQASANRQYGPKAIALLEQGLSPEEVIKRITDEDPGRDTRQVAVIDTKGRSAVYTGKRVIDRNSDPKDLVHLGGYAGHVSGREFFRAGQHAGQQAGGRGDGRRVPERQGRDGREAHGRARRRPVEGRRYPRHAVGRHSRGAAVAGQLGNTVERIVDIRVDDSDEPFKELRRLLNMTLGVPNRLTSQSADLAKAGKFAEAIATQKKALEINPRSEPATYAPAQRYAQAGDTKQAIEQLAVALRGSPAVEGAGGEDRSRQGEGESSEFKRLIER